LEQQPGFAADPLEVIKQLFFDFPLGLSPTFATRPIQKA
jgi:hypothetical protein